MLINQMLIANNNVQGTLPALLLSPRTPTRASRRREAIVYALIPSSPYRGGDLIGEYFDWLRAVQLKRYEEDFITAEAALEADRYNLRAIQT